MPGVLARCGTGRAVIFVVGAVRLRPRHHVVRPAHVMRVQQIREIGPSVIGPPGLVDGAGCAARKSGGKSGVSNSLTQLIGSPIRLHHADHSETMKRCCGKLHDAFGSKDGPAARNRARTSNSSEARARRDSP